MSLFGRESAARFGVLRQVVHREHPQEAHEEQDCGDRHDVAQNGAVADGHVVPGVLHGVGQLHAQQGEHHAVQGERQHVPHALRHDRKLRHGRPDLAVGEDRHGEAGGHHGQDAAHAQAFRHQVDDEGHRDFEEHVEGRGIEPQAACAVANLVPDPAERHAQKDAAHEHGDERGGGVSEREGARHGRGDRELESHDTRCVVQQRLARKQGAFGARELGDLRQARHGYGVGGAQGGAQGEGGGERNRGLE